MWLLIKKWDISNGAKIAKNAILAPFLFFHILGYNDMIYLKRIRFWYRSKIQSKFYSLNYKNWKKNNFSFFPQMHIDVLYTKTKSARGKGKHASNLKTMIFLKSARQK